MTILRMFKTSAGKIHTSLPARSISFRPRWKAAPFSTSFVGRKKSEAEQHDEVQKETKKARRASAGKTSLRRVSIEAERSRLIINRAGRRFIDPGVNTKKVTAYCAAEQYDINIASRILREDGFDLDPFHTGLFPQVVHVQTAPLVPRSQTINRDKDSHEPGDVFIFPSGTVVAWNVPKRTALRLVQRVLPTATINSHSGYFEIEKEDLEYIEDITRERSDIVGDTIIIGTRSGFDVESISTRRDDPEKAVAQVPPSSVLPITEADTVLAKIAFSSGLARSTKLAVLERLTDTYVESTRSIPLIMSRGTPLPLKKPLILKKACELFGFGSRLPFSRPFILRKTGELLSIRAQLNLYSELTDSLPDLFWDSRHDLGLENYYDMVGRALDIGVRIKVLNEKMDYAQEIASVLRETLSERHNLRLEWGIIILIFIEVVFEFTQRWDHHMEKDDHNALKDLVRRFLEVGETNSTSPDT